MNVRKNKKSDEFSKSYYYFCVCDDFGQVWQAVQKNRQLFKAFGTNNLAFGTLCRFTEVGEEFLHYSTHRAAYTQILRIYCM